MIILPRTYATVPEFWDIVDRQYNRELFEKDEYGRWRLKENLK